MATKPEEWESESESSESEKFTDAGSEASSAESHEARGILDKDSDEEELERLVLGDKAGFRENLFKSGADADGDEYEDDFQMGEADVGGLEEVDDADLFMLDTGTGAGSGAAPVAARTKEHGDAPAWEDSDDERLVVSLAGATRLRKLRTTEADDFVTGAEYSRRLRQQFLRLNPAPAWARETNSERPSKRRRSSAAADSDSSSDDSNAADDLSAQPLEKLLRDVRRLAGQDGGKGSSRKRRLQPEVINIQKTREIPDTHTKPVSSLSFHPEFPVLLSSSAASLMYLHHIAPEAQPTPNPQLTSVQAKGVNVQRAAFLYPKGDKIFFAGRRRYFHSWDLPSGVVQKTTQIAGHSKEHKYVDQFRLSPCGRYMGIVATDRKGSGVINILDVASTKWITAARLSSRHGIADYAWWSNGNGMTILGVDGQVGEYSLESRAFIGIWHDDGCIGGKVIALGGHGGPQTLGEDRWVAVGSSTGIANIYERSTLIELANNKADDAPPSISIKERPTPTRVLEQLITAVTVLTFSPDGQLLAVASGKKTDAFRLVHLPSCTVYRNWPTQQTPLGRITAVAFGSDSDVLAVGNDAGKIRLWQIRS